MTFSGDDAEFLGLFAQEAEQRLTRLGQELLLLEEAGRDEALIDSIFRDAHTLKGSAAVVGLTDVSRIAHAMEDLLEQLRSGERMATPTLIDGLLQAVDGLVSVIPAAIDGDDQSNQADTIVLALLAAATSAAEEPSGTTEQGAPVVEAMPVVRSTPLVLPSVDSVVPPVTATADGPDQRHRPNVETVMVPVTRLDELVALVGESAAAHLRVGRMLSERLRLDPGSVPEFHILSRVLNDLQERTMRTRMVPVATITDSLHRAVRDLARTLGKDIRWEARGVDTELDRKILQQLADPLLHLVRNAVDHGIEEPAERVAVGKPEQATIRLHAMQMGSEVTIVVSDDGRGIDIERVRAAAVKRGDDLSEATDEDVLYCIFRSGLSTARFVSDVSGRGVGLDVVRASIDAARGRIEVHSVAGEGSEFRIIVPITLAVLPCLLVDAGSQRYAIPMHSVVVAQAATTTVKAHAEGRPVVWVGGDAITVSDLAGTLGLKVGDEVGPGHVVVVGGVTRRHAFRVDSLVGQRDVVVKGLGRLLPRLDVLAGASVEPDGSILLVLDAPGIIDRARLARAGPYVVADPLDNAEGAARTNKATILVVDDALTIRELERSILERAGYVVLTASDGAQALARLAEGPCDLVLTDVEMPTMDGFALTEAIRADEALMNLPVLILTSRASDDDRRRGLEAGADGYLVKSAFDETALLGAIERFLGRPR